jgi:putative ubiquitin-RnfH superfamily antitoxin RatB of RatAB toxin-antitoxin module
VRPADAIEVEVVHAWPDRCWSRTLALPPGARVGDALDAVSAEASSEALDLPSLGLAVFGRLAGRDTPLRDGDRIELLRPLRMDPRQARAARAAAARKRAAAQGRESRR